MEVIRNYETLEDRKVIDSEMTSQGYRMIHDNFSEGSGYMVYTDDPEPPPAPTNPPCSTHLSVLVAVDPSKVKPAKVKRMWEGREYFYDCFATQTVKDEYVAGKIQLGDYVLVHYDDCGEQVVTAKIFKSWG